mgnify:CR=1 FL=1
MRVARVGFTSVKGTRHTAREVIELDTHGAVGDATSVVLLDTLPAANEATPVLVRAVAQARPGPGLVPQAARELDLLQAPLVRTLLGIRALPLRVAGTLRGRGKTTTPEASRRTFRLKDMVGLGWILLGETPDVDAGEVTGRRELPGHGVGRSPDDVGARTVVAPEQVRLSIAVVIRGRRRRTNDNRTVHEVR